MPMWEGEGVVSNIQDKTGTRSSKAFKSLRVHFS